MGVLPWLMAEVTQRARLLRLDVEQRYRQTVAKDPSEDLHYSQSLSLCTMMNTLFHRQDALFAGLRADGNAALSGKYRELLVEITGSQALWHIFQRIFDQRADAYARTILDTADLIAYECYSSCIRQAVAWGLVKDGQFREPPLTCLDAVHSPLAAARTSPVQSLGMHVGLYHAVQLPIPITILPIDHITSLWLFSVLPHEVGHHLDQDLHGPDLPSLSSELQTLIRSSPLITNAVRRDDWGRWCPEILADVFGVLLGGAGFAYTLGSLLIPLAAAAGGSPVTSGAYPPSLVRLHLLIQLLQSINQPSLTTAADWLEQQIAALKPADSLAPAIAEGQAIARLLIERTFAALGTRRLIDLVPTLADDLQAAEALAGAFLGTASHQPDPRTCAYRLVPSAAQIALVRLADPDEAALKRLHEQALAFAGKIIRPQRALNAGFMPSDAYIQQLSERIRFTADAL